MYRLDELIDKLCPNGIQYRKLEDCCNILDNKRKPVKKETREKGKYPYYGANGIQDYVSDYIFDGKFVLVGEDGSVITTYGTPVTNWAEGKIWVNNHAHVIEEKQSVMLRYLFFYIQTINVTHLIHGNIPKLNQKDFRSLNIAVPPIEVQEEIVKILDKFSLLKQKIEKELEKELDVRRKQYEQYRNNLIKKLNKNDESKTFMLQDILKIKNGKDYKHLEKGSYPVYGTGGIMTYVDKFVYDKPSVLIPRKGSLDKLYYVDKPFWNVDTIFYTEINENRVIPKFLYYYLQNEHLEKLNIAGGIPSLTQKTLNKVKITIPSLEEQAKIVSILDEFDKLYNDLSETLYAEIKTRQKQFEFYKDKLLTFNKIKNIY